MTNAHAALHVVHVCCTNSFAGVERHVSELALAQASTGDRVVVVGGEPSRMREAVGVSVEVLPGHRLDVAMRTLRRLQLRPDVVNVHMTAAEVAVALVRSLRGVPVISTRHFASRRGARRVTKSVTRLGTRRVDTQIAVSNYVASLIDGPSTVVLSGVRPDPDRRTTFDRDPVVLVAQRLEHEKRTDVAVRAFALAGLARKGWRLRIAGGGSLKPALEDLVARLGIADAVEFLGYRRDVDALMRTASIFLAPRPDEAFGLSVVEAMAHALPVLAAGSGAHLETVGSVEGAALFRPGDTNDAARLLVGLADDDQARDEYGVQLQSAQRARFTVDVQARNTDVVYRSLL